MASRKAKKPETSPSKTRSKYVVRWVLTLCVWGLIGVLGLLTYYAADLPDLEKASAAPRRPGITLVSRDGLTIATQGQIYGDPIQAEDAPEALIQAIVATEDRRFFSHFGLDVLGLARAMAANLWAMRVVQGGSTLTQQAAKNLFLTSERSFSRKIKEAMLALWLERKFTKNQILTMYLNRVYLGAGTYGVDAAARRYFGRSAKNLSLYQSALIAGLLKAPTRYSPANDPKLSAKRTQQVLLNMVAAGYLTQKQADEAMAAGSGWSATAKGRGGSGRHFTDWVLEQVPSFIGGVDRDLIITTTLDLGLQRQTEALFKAMIEGPGKDKGVSQGAVMVLAPDGSVRAMVGGTSYGRSQFNRATQAMRQPGSAFKPFVYLTALEMGLDPQYRLFDEPVTVEGWSPQNFSKDFAGEISLTDGLARSINTVAVRVQEMAGRDRVADMARRLGILTPLTNRPSLALGVSEVTLFDLTAAYMPMANGGYALLPYGIDSIRDKEGRTLYQRGAQGAGLGQVIKPQAAAAINQMLAYVVAEGTGKAARLAIPAAGKTGTSQDFRDAWFIGYTSGYTAGVWMGNDDNGPTKRLTGGSLPARLWKQIMEAAHGLK